MQWFVTGTDTDAGKTFVTGMLAAMFYERGHSVGVVKPVASGAEVQPDGSFLSGDASFLMKMAHIPEDQRNEVNPYCFLDAVAPDLAAQLAGVTVDRHVVEEVCRAASERYEYSLVEGAGGLTTGIAPDYDMTALAQNLQIPLLLVCDAKLGSINRVITSVYWAQGHGLEVAGLILNQVTDPDSLLVRTNRETMERRTGIPVLGVVPPYEGEMTSASLAAFAEKILATEQLLNK